MKVIVTDNTHLVVENAEGKVLYQHLPKEKKEPTVININANNICDKFDIRSFIKGFEKANKLRGI